MKRALFWMLGGAALAAVAAAWFMLRREAPPLAKTASTIGAPSAVQSAPPGAAAEPVIKYPVPGPQGGPTADTPLDVASALDRLFGRTTVLSWFQLPDFPRRFVATVDNLGRSQATPSLWPINPVGGRFLTLKRGPGEVIDPDNGVRYAPYVQLLEKIDLPQAVSLYARIYPIFQREYADLGYPNGHFNDRLVEVIDQLLMTPESEDLQRVHLPSVSGSAPPVRPWILYEFDDESLQSLSSGQRILLRMGSVNERRVKARLAELRRLLISPEDVAQRKGAPQGAPK